jgi:hypothetical protein
MEKFGRLTFQSVLNARDALPDKFLAAKEKPTKQSK